MKNKYFKITRTITLAILLAGIVNISKASFISSENLKNICLECFEVDQAEEMREESSQLEDWMVNDEFWRVDNSTNNSILEFEVSPNEEFSEIENWMIDDDFWIQEENENSEYVIEPWMTDTDFWKI